MGIPRKIEVLVGTTGNVDKMEVIGDIGAGCLKLTENLEKLLGTVKKRTLKPEHAKVAQVAEKMKLGY